MSTATETVQKYVSHEGETVESKENSVAQEGHAAKAKQSITGSGSGSQLSQQFASPRHPYLPSARDTQAGRGDRPRGQGSALLWLSHSRPSLHPPTAPFCSRRTPQRAFPPPASSISVALRSGGGQHSSDPTRGVILRRGLSCPCSAHEKTVLGLGAWLADDRCLQPWGL